MKLEELRKRLRRQIQSIASKATPLITHQPKYVGDMSYLHRCPKCDCVYEVDPLAGYVPSTCAKCASYF
jgi:hypothetical protein